MTRLWDEVRTAAEGRGAGRADVIATLSNLDGRARLGWVIPPSPAHVESVLARWDGPELLVLAGTGGWAFGARAVTEGTPGAGRVRVLDSLDPATVLRIALTTRWPRSSRSPRCFAASASGATHETRVLADTLAAIWPDPGVRRLSEQDRTLSLSGDSDLVALYGAPLSVPALLAARTAAGPDFAEAYRVFADHAGRIGSWAADLSRRVASTDRPRVTFRLPTGSGDGLRLWTLQAARQGWSGKSLTFRPWTTTIAATGPHSGIEVDVAAPLPAGPPSARALAAPYAVAALVVCVAIRRGLTFSTHEAVARYKALIPVADNSDAEVHLGGPDEVAAAVKAWRHSRPDLNGVHVVTYGEAVTAAVAARIPAEPGVEVHAGSAWNHHSYQAVWHEPTIGVVVVLGPDPATVTGDPRVDAALKSQVDTQRAIARATYASLAPRALLLRCAEATWARPVEEME